MAEQLGLELDGIESSYELLPADERFDFQGRRIEAGTIAAMRFEIVGVVGGQPKVAVEHVTRTKADQAPGGRGRRRPMPTGSSSRGHRASTARSSSVRA